MNEETGSSLSTRLLSEIIDDFMRRRRRGETPSLSSLTAQHPELAQELRELLPLVSQVEDASRTTGASQAPTQLGDYQLVEEIGRGAMGIVYRTHHQSLDREVALKVLTQVRATDGLSRRRFQQEARVAARLHHKNIVPVFDVGEVDGVCYFTMPLIDGVPLNHLRLSDLPESTNDTNQLLPKARNRWMVFANLLAQAADGLAHAHHRGVIHRDIKPSNLILDRDWTLWISDFGLAKLSDVDLTHSGEMPGTLRYLAPERLRGKCDERADIYGVGATAYEICTGRPLIEGRERGKILAAIANQTEVFARVHNPTIPRDLESIIHKCVEKNPTRRYQSAEALAEDLRRFARSEPIEARHVSQVELFRRWAGKHWILAASLTVALVSMLVAIAGLGRVALVQSQRRQQAESHRLREQHLRSESERQASIAEEQASRTLRELYVAEMNLAGQMAASGTGVTHLAPIIARWDANKAEGPGRIDDSISPGWEWGFLTHVASTRQVPLLPKDPARDDSAGENAASENGSAIVATNRQGLFAVADSKTISVVRNGATTSLFIPSGVTVIAMSWSPDGSRLAVAFDNGVFVVHREDGTESTWDGFDPPIAGLEWLDNTRCAIAGDFDVLVWNVDMNHSESHTFDRKVTGLQRGDGLLIEHAEGWATWTNTQLERQSARNYKGQRLALHPTEPLLAVARGRLIELVAVGKTGESTVKIEAQRQRISALAWNHTGSILASATAQGTIRLWDLRRAHLAAGNALLRPAEFTLEYRHHAPVHSLRFLDDLRLVVSHESPGSRLTMSVIELGPEKARTVVPVQTTPGSRQTMTWHPDGERIAIADADRGLLLREYEQLRKLDATPCSSVCFSPDGNQLAYVCHEGELRIFELTANRWSRVPGVFRTTVAWGNRSELFALKRDGSLIKWDVAAGCQNAGVKIEHAVRKLTFCAPKAILAVVQRQGTVLFLSSESLQTVRSTTVADRFLQDLAFSPDGKRFAVAHEEFATIWDWEEGVELHRLVGHSAGVVSIAWHPNQPRIATGGADRRVCVWDARDGRRLLQLDGHGSPVSTVLWNPTGTTLGSVGCRCYAFLRHASSEPSGASAQ